MDVVVADSTPTTARALLRAGDEALYLAKSRGGGQVVKTATSHALNVTREDR